MHVCGIDVGAKSLMSVVVKHDKAGPAREFANSPEGHGRLVGMLRRAGVERVCLEATGQYHLDLALALDTAGLAVMVLDPKAAKHFAAALSTRTKTDAVDAGVLAQFALRMAFEPWQRPSDQALTIRACARRLEALTHSRTQAKNQLHAASRSKLTPTVVLDDLRLSIKRSDAQIANLRRHTTAVVGADEHLSAIFELLLTVKGIAEASAIQIMGEVLVLPEGMKAKQWVALAGLDPRAHESGSSVHKKPRLSKSGNRHLRVALFMPALSAARHEPQVRGFYLHLVHTRGLKKIQAVCAVMRKLLPAIHAMLGQMTPFDPQRFYTPAVQSA